MKHLFADMDGTICESHQKITPRVKEKLEKILGDIVVISGAKRERMEFQLDGLKCDILAQNGNDTKDWQNKLSDADILEIHKHIDKLKEWLKPYDDKIEMVENRGCQISLSFTGHNAPLDYKKKFDPRGKFRQLLLTHHPFKSKRISCKIAGTTCLDYIPKHGTKGDNLKRYMRLHQFKKEDCVYYGDSLFEGGNDESVLEVMKCVEVKNPDDLLTKL